MKKIPIVQPLLLLVFFALANACFAATFTATLSTTPTNRACYSGSFLVNYTTTVIPQAGSGYVYPTNYTFDLTQTKFELRKTSTGPMGTVLATNTGGTTGSSTISGSFDISSLGTIAAALKPDVYTIYATIYVNDIPLAATRIVYAEATFTVGYETSWADLVNMTASPNSYSCKRNITSAGITYAKSRSSNYLAGGSNGWFETGSQFASSGASVYAKLSDYNAATAFDPSASGNYLEFRKGGTITAISGEGIYVKNGTTVYKLQGVVLSDRIRIERISGTVKFYKTNTTTALNATNVSTSATVSPLSFTLTNEWLVMGQAASVNDGLSNVIAGFSCSESVTTYAKLERELTGVNYAANDKLYFYYDEEYLPAAASLNYRILNLQHKTVQSSAVVSGSTQVTAGRIYGDNRYELSVTSLTPGNTYILEVTNEKKEVFYLRFTKK